jgi:multiple sugar transport system permease protein
MTIGPAVAKIWRWAFAPQRGPINLTLDAVGLPQQPFLNDPDQALYAMIVVLIWAGLGFSTVLMLAGLTQIPRIYYEAALVDGANNRQLFRHITLPLLNPTLVLYLVTSTISALQTFTMAFLLTAAPGGILDSTRTVMLHVYEVGFTRLKMGYAASITVSVLIFMLVLTVIQLRVTTRRFEY